MLRGFYVFRPTVTTTICLRNNAVLSDLPKFPNLNLSAMPGLYWTDGNAGMPQLQQLDSPALSPPGR